jgi:hypothetical protein
LIDLIDAPELAYQRRLLDECVERDRDLAYYAVGPL